MTKQVAEGARKSPSMQAQTREQLELRLLRAENAMLREMYCEARTQLTVLMQELKLQGS